MAKVKRTKKQKQSAAKGKGKGRLHEATLELHLALAKEALEATQLNDRWNVNAAARELGIARSYMYRLIALLAGPRQTVHEEGWTLRRAIDRSRKKRK
jgi:transcriptional regulator of acetoin/glycerol metabolism